MFSTIIQPYPNLRTVCLGVVTHRGAAHDTLAGVTQVLLQTMVRGTKQHKELEIARFIDGTGGSLFSATEKDFSIIGAQIQPKYAIRTLDLLQEMISFPTLDEDHVSIGMNRYDSHLPVRPCWHPKDSTGPDTVHCGGLTTRDPAP